MIFGIILASCADGKKGDHTKDAEISKDQLEQNEGEEVKDHGYETAMASYQCPMKCEGEKSYEEAGSCPVCKMDLKKIETDHDAVHTEKSEAHEEGTE